MLGMWAGESCAYKWAVGEGLFEKVSLKKAKAVRHT